VTDRRRRPLDPRKGFPQLAISFFLLSMVFAEAGCGRMPRVIVLTDPLSAEEHMELGVAYERNGEFDLAIREYERALRKEKGFFQARVNLGNVWLGKKEYEKARKEYRNALAIRPGDPEATNNLAWTAILSGEQREEAEERMEAVLSRPENRSAILYDTIGVLRMRLGKLAAAEEAFTEAERLCLEADGEGCSQEILREIRDHRSEKEGRIPSSAPPPLVQ
jgi:tetratricopeptide (TPR) repeat protein